MSKILWAKYYQENQERLLKKVVKDIKNFFKKKKKKCSNMVVNVTKISQKKKNSPLFSIEKSIIEWEKIPHHNYKKHLF